MVLGMDNNEIVELAVENSGDIVNGICAYDCMENKLVGFSLFNNESMHPDDTKNYIFLFKVNQNTDFDMQCYDCPFNDPEGYEPDEYSYQSKEQCCLDCWVEKCIEDFDDDNRDHIEHQIREIIDRIIWEDLDKLNQIRLKIYENFYSYTQYQQELFNNNYEMEVLDELVDNAYDYGLSIDSPQEFLSGSVDEIARILEYLRDTQKLNKKENTLAYNVHEALWNYKLDEALKLLK